jgi:hypothetical protein
MGLAETAIQEIPADPAPAQCISETHHPVIEPVSYPRAGNGNLLRRDGPAKSGYTTSRDGCRDAQECEKPPFWRNKCDKACGSLSPTTAESHSYRPSMTFTCGGDWLNRGVSVEWFAVGHDIFGTAIRRTGQHSVLKTPLGADQRRFLRIRTSGFLTPVAIPH